MDLVSRLGLGEDVRRGKRCGKHTPNCTDGSRRTQVATLLMGWVSVREMYHIPYLVANLLLKSGQWCGYGVGTILFRLGHCIGCCACGCVRKDQEHLLWLDAVCNAESELQVSKETVTGELVYTSRAQNAVSASSASSTPTHWLTSSVAAGVTSTDDGMSFEGGPALLCLTVLPSDLMMASWTPDKEILKIAETSRWQHVQGCSGLSMS